MDVIKELKFLGKFTKKNWGGGSGVEGSGLGGQGGCDQRIEVLGKIHKKIRGRGSRGVRWGGGGVGVVGGGQGGCERRIEVFRKFKKKMGGGGLGGSGWM